MKMKLYDRILLGLYALLGVAVSIFLALLGVSAYRNDGLAVGFMGIQLPGGILTLVVALAVAVVLLIWSVKMFLLAFKHAPRIDKTSVSVQNTEDGSVRITVAALDTLIKQAIGHHEGILDVKSKIVNQEDSISVQIEMTLASDVHIPNVTMLLQRTVKNFIEEFSGIAVREVAVLVTSIVEIVPPPLAIEAGAGKPPIDGEVIEPDDEPEAVPAAAYEEKIEDPATTDEAEAFAPPIESEAVELPKFTWTQEEQPEDKQDAADGEQADTQDADHPEKEIW